jgi:hypothetical protein
VRIRDLNWMHLEEYLEEEDRIVLPVGSTEQHAYLSLETDNILAERASVEAAEPLGVPVLPVFAYGVTGFTAYPGSPTQKQPVVWPEEGNPRIWREALGDGSFGGLYQRSAEDENRVWQAAVEGSASAASGRALSPDRRALEGGALDVRDDARTARLVVTRDEHRHRLGRGLAVAGQDRLAGRHAPRPEPLERAARDDRVVLEGQLSAVVDLDARDDVAPDERRVCEHAAEPFVAHLLEVGEEDDVIDVVEGVEVAPADLDLLLVNHG